MRIEQFLIGLIFFSAIMVGGAMMFSNVSNNYGLNENMTLFNGTTDSRNKDSVYYIIDDLETDVTASTKDKILGGEVSVSEDTAEDNLIAASIRGINVVGKSFKVTTLIIDEIAIRIGIPPFLRTAIFLTFVLTILFTIMYIIFKFNPR